jgi:soluble epoxide hydrolase / lipid-phosphate phosphatase
LQHERRLTLPRYPELVSRVFSVCTPYTAPHKDYVSLEDIVKGPLPQFGYQIHLASGEVEKSVNSEDSIRQFLRGVYGARTPEGETSFDPVEGVLLKNLPKIGESRLLNGKVSLSWSGTIWKNRMCATLY